MAGNGNVVYGGTVVRMVLDIPQASMPAIESMTVVGSGFPERSDPAALVIGPTGVQLSGKTLFVADSLSNRIAAIPNALERTTSASRGQTVSTGGSLNDPLGLTVAPNGYILTTNGGNGFMVETTSDGHQVVKFLLDDSGNPPGAGALFGLTVPAAQSVYFVDDATNTLNLFH